MAKITGILCQMITSEFDGSSTDGNIYLGVGGREFHLDSTDDDFQAGSYREYILGDPPIELTPPPPRQVHVKNKNDNDPRKGFKLDTSNLSRSPVYIRFEPESSGDHWNLNFASVLVYDTKFFIGYTPPAGFDNLWLGNRSGKIMYLTLEHTTGGVKVLSIARELAAKMKK
jgi:hypothetical protein